MTVLCKSLQHITKNDLNRFDISFDENITDVQPHNSKRAFNTTSELRRYFIF